MSSVFYFIAAAIGVSLTIYLVYTFFHPERF